MMLKESASSTTPNRHILVKVFRLYAPGIHAYLTNPLNDGWMVDDKLGIATGIREGSGPGIMPHF